MPSVRPTSGTPLLWDSQLYGCPRTNSVWCMKSSGTWTRATFYILPRALRWMNRDVFIWRCLRTFCIPRLREDLCHLQGETTRIPWRRTTMVARHDVMFVHVNDYIYPGI